MATHDAKSLYKETFHLGSHLLWESLCFTLFSGFGVTLSNMVGKALRV